jgi:hypothetical protein
VTSGMARSRGRWLRLAVILVVVVVLAFTAFQLLDSPSRIEYYRVVDDRTVAVGTVSGPRAWVRVTGVTETSTDVTITVRTFFVQLGPSTAVGINYESMVTLHAPLAGRTVIDGTSGLPVQQVRCYPPTVFASPCP